MEALENHDKYKIWKKFTTTTFNAEPIGDVPLHIIYRQIYNPNTVVVELEKGKNFIQSIMDIRKDFNISYIEGKDNIPPPQYYNDVEYFTDLFTHINKETLNNHLESIKDWSYSPTEFEYKCTHPCVKRFMGPDKIDIHDKYKVYFVSPLCMIVELYSYLSGFMLMDTFYTVFQYRFDTEISFKEGRFTFNTVISVKFSFEFIKACLVKSAVESNGTTDNIAFIKDIFFPNMCRVVQNQSKVFYDNCFNFINLKNNLNPLPTVTFANEINFAIYQNQDKNLINCNIVY